MSAGQSNQQSSVKKIIRDFYSDRDDVAAVYIFGSLLGSTYSEQSDIDVGVLYQTGSTPVFERRMHEQAELSDHLKVQVDLVPLNQVSPILGYQVLKYGECVLCRDQRAADLFFVHTLNEYFDLKRNRQIIEHSLHKLRIL